MFEKNVLDYGVKGDGYTRESDALQAVLDRGGRIYIPAGKYRIDKPLALSSHTRLRAHPEAFLFLEEGFGKEKTSFLLTNRKNAEDIWVEGGIWNGNADKNPRGKSITGDAYLGVMIQFADMTDLHLKSMTVQDAEAFHIRLNYVKHFTIEDITIEDMVCRFTQDGIHLAGGCEDGEIARIRAVGPSCPNDDMISLISDANYNYMAEDDPALGQRPGPIRRINIHDIYADNTFSFLRLFSVKEPLEDITVTNVRGGCYYLAVQLEITPYERVRPDCQTPEYFGAGNIRNIRLSDFHVHQRLPFGYPREGWEMRHVGGLIDLEQSIRNLTVENFTRDMVKDAWPDQPTLHVRNMRKNALVYHAGEDACLRLNGEAETLPAHAERKLQLNAEDTLDTWGSIRYLRFHTEE